MGISVDSTEEEEEGEEENSHHDMEVEWYFEGPPPQNEKTHEEPTVQTHQYQVEEGQLMQKENLMQEGHPSQERSSLQEGPLAWFLEYFGKLNATMERMK